jgi:cytoskeletal protein CcmA (bactofilin family)
MVAPAAPALVPKGGHFEGEVAVSGETRIEGRVEGGLRGSGRVVVGPDGCIEGAVECEQLDSEGTIRGPIVARERVRLGPGALLQGDVATPLIEVEDSAVWQGIARVGVARSKDAEES